MYVCGCRIDTRAGEADILVQRGWLTRSSSLKAAESELYFCMLGLCTRNRLHGTLTLSRAISHLIHCSNTIILPLSNADFMRCIFSLLYCIFTAFVAGVEPSADAATCVPAAPHSPKHTTETVYKRNSASVLLEAIPMTSEKSQLLPTSLVDTAEPNYDDARTRRVLALAGLALVRNLSSHLWP